MKQPDDLQCGFCYPREQGTHGPVKREWSIHWSLFIPVCPKHSFEGKEDDTKRDEGGNDEAA